MVYHCGDSAYNSRFKQTYQLQKIKIKQQKNSSNELHHGHILNTIQNLAEVISFYHNEKKWP